jgi:hypothetical protein
MEKIRFREIEKRLKQNKEKGEPKTGEEDEEDEEEEQRKRLEEARIKAEMETREKEMNKLRGERDDDKKVRA